MQFLALFPVSTALAYAFIITSYQPMGFLVAGLCFPQFYMHNYRVSIQITAQGLSSQSKLIQWLPISRGSKESNPNSQLSSEGWHWVPADTPPPTSHTLSLIPMGPATPGHRPS